MNRQPFAHFSHIILEMQLSLKPDNSLKPSSYLRFTQKIVSVNAYVKLHIITFDRHLADFFARQCVLKGREIQDFTHDVVFITFDSVRHKI